MALGPGSGTVRDVNLVAAATGLPALGIASGTTAPVEAHAGLAGTSLQRYEDH